MPGTDKSPKKWGAPDVANDDAICFLGREREARKIKEALGKKESMLISGPADIGKTALMKHVLRSLSKEAGSHCLYIGGFKDLQDLLRKLLKTLYRAGGPTLRRQLRAKGVSAATLDAWLKATPSPQLKGALYRSVEHTNCHVTLDHVPPLTHAIAKVIKELFWMRDTPVYLLVRDAPEHKIDQFIDFFYWGRRERLLLGPLPKRVAAEMLERCISGYRLSQFNLDKFREEVLDMSGCVPGAIIKMCAMATDKRYRFGSSIKTKLIHIDYLIETGLRSERQNAGGRRRGKGLANF